MFGLLKKFNQPDNWQRWQRGQAMMEYWPTFPVGVMVMIAASAIVGPIQDAFQTTADSLNLVVCDVSELPPYVELDGGHRVEIIASAYDEGNDRTTVTFHVSSGDQPSISHWVLGLDEDTAGRIVASTELAGDYAQDPTTGKWGIKFDTGYDEGGSGGTVHSRAAAPAYNTYVEERDITLTLTGRVDFVDEVEVTTKAGSDQVSSGYIGIPMTVTVTGDCPESGNNNPPPTNNNDNTGDNSDKGGPKGNNGVGNGLDGQPPGDPPENDTGDASPGNPGNKGGAKK